MGSQNLARPVAYVQNVRLFLAMTQPQFRLQVQGGRGGLQPKGIGDMDLARPLVQTVL